MAQSELVETQRFEADAEAEASPRYRWLRVGLLLALIGGLVLVARATGLTERVELAELEKLRAGLLAAGLCGGFAFIGIFAAANLLQLPGMVFVTAGIVAYGGLLGGLVTFVASAVAVSLTFLVFRAVGGRPLASVRKPFLRKMLGRLENAPVSTIVVLRTFFQTSPLLNATLAMSGVRFRDYLVGSMAGMLLPVAAVSVFVEVIGI